LKSDRAKGDPARRPSFIVGIGGSAGALDAYKAFLAAVPANTGMAFVIVAHLLPTASSELVKILSRCTIMPVKRTVTGMPIEANSVYVIPPDADLLIVQDAFQVATPRTIRNVQVDLFLTSLATAMGPRAIGIIFSGYDGDGAAGIERIKAQGGTTFAQDKSAEIDGMPLSARETGCIDFVLPPEDIPAELLRLVRSTIDQEP
jgi:two-component system CheB/CheR fusion protein